MVWKRKGESNSSSMQVPKSYVIPTEMVGLLCRAKIVRGYSERNGQMNCLGGLKREATTRYTHIENWKHPEVFPK